MCEQIRKSRLDRLFRREMFRSDLAKARGDLDGAELHLKRAAAWLKAMNLPFMKGSAA